MKEKEINLSEKDNNAWKLYADSVIGLDELRIELERNKKEFIKRLKAEIEYRAKRGQSMKVLPIVIDKLAGDKLTKS